jgi:diguanylate cyclase (GGDEF)-like protein
MLKRNEAPAPSKPLDEKTLQEELEHLSLLLRQRRGCGAQEERGRGGLLALARLVRGVTLEEWERLSGEMGSRQWLALPLEGDSYPTLVQLQERLEDLAYQTDHDPLTGLYNRRAFDRLLDMELQRMQRQRSHLSLVMLDLDDFKQINDTYGHSFGDHVLRGLAHSLVRSKRVYDHAARLGGEEFALVLPGTGARTSLSMIQRLQEVFWDMEFKHEGREAVRVTFSAGIATCRGVPREGAKALLDLADDAMYQAKAAGKNTVVIERFPEDEALYKATMVHSDEKKFLFSGE